jgi:hypothetical protein
VLPDENLPGVPQEVPGFSFWLVIPHATDYAQGWRFPRQSTAQPSDRKCVTSGRYRVQLSPNSALLLPRIELGAAYPQDVGVSMLTRLLPKSKVFLDAHRFLPGLAGSLPVTLRSYIAC